MKRIKIENQNGDILNPLVPNDLLHLTQVELLAEYKRRAYDLAQKRGDEFWITRQKWRNKYRILKKFLEPKF